MVPRGAARHHDADAGYNEMLMLATLPWAAVAAAGASATAAATAATATAPPALTVKWPAFLGRADVTSSWSRPSAAAAWEMPAPPFTYDTAAFLGNGNVGAMVQASPDGSVTMVLGRTDAYDRRVPGSRFAVDDLLCDVAKLPIGNLTLHTAGAVLSASTRVRLWDGEVTVQLNTTAGQISSRLLAFGGGAAPSAGGSGIIVAASNSTGGEAARWLFTAANANANAPHPVYKTESYACSNKNYKANPPAVAGRSGGLATWTQRLRVGPSWALALGEDGSGAAGVTALSTTAPLAGNQTAAKLAIEDTAWALKAWADGSLLAQHRAEWHQFYTAASFVSVDHPRLEQFYWVTQYKLGSGMGLRGDLAGDGGAMDHTSPWFLPNNGLFNWDLNIEMTWWSVAGANRPQLIEPLLRLLERNAGDFCANVVRAARDPKGCTGTGPFATLAGPSAHTGYVSIGRIEVGHGTPEKSNPDRSIEPPGPLGDLSWTLYNVEQIWRFTLNMTTAKRLWPLLSGAANHYVHWLGNKTTPDGRYHLPPTHSPEYLKGPGDGDTSYELAIARWGFGAALRLASELGIQDARTSVWQDRFENLANYSIDPIRGINVAKNLPFDVPHRHFSHLMGAVLKEPALCANTSLIKTSVDNWRSFRDPCAMPDRPNISDPGFVGFSYAVSAMLNARLQRADIAVHDITWMAEHSAVEGQAGAREGPLPLPPQQCPARGPMLGSTFHANTFYAEGVGDPTGETPFGTCAALQELLVGTGPDGRIVAFPGFGDGSVPTKLSGKACFNDLRVDGAFLVSGCFHQNATSFVSVLSEAGQPCRLELPSLRLPLAVLPASVSARSTSDPAVIELNLAAGQRATVYTQGESTAFAISAVDVEPGERNFWGQKPRAASVSLNAE